MCVHIPIYTSLVRPETLYAKHSSPPSASGMTVTTTTTTLPPGYFFHDAPPPLEKYLELRAHNGLSPKTPEQGQGALTGSWAWCTVLYTPPSTLPTEPEVVGMIRVIGDGGWYFLISDMCVQTKHRRKGLGEALLRRLLSQIEERAPPHPLISLSADPPGRKLYEKLGFVESAPRSVGMWFIPGDKDAASA
ncbi:hypothetical protein PENSPDRAFT_92029 [Peniophora sp. CONT]|nr:hypothetical protein PENSPDRAFT_92029 [Peniophora sp. CONT]